MPVGTVKFFNTQKGFGFIQPDDGSKDVFVHITAVERAGMRSLVEGQKISFEIVTERGKQAAGNLQPVYALAIDIKIEARRQRRAFCVRRI